MRFEHSWLKLLLLIFSKYKRTKHPINSLSKCPFIYTIEDLIEMSITWKLQVENIYKTKCLFFQLNACGPISHAASNEAKPNVKRDLMIAQLERVVRRIKPLSTKCICINCSIKDANLSDFDSMTDISTGKSFKLNYWRNGHNHLWKTLPFTFT